MHQHTVGEVAATIDHAVLKPNQTEADLRAAALLEGSGVKVSCVLSFPHGADTPATKVFQAEEALRDGAREIDMVMNIGRFLSGDFEAVRRDILGVAETAHSAGALVKTILETGFLTLEQVETACQIVLDAGADFVKTSTGFAPVSATPEAVRTMVRVVGGKIGVKASGGIRTWEQAVAYLEMGATRLGMGATETVLSGGTAEEPY